MPAKRTTQEFIDQAKRLHGDLFSYSRTEYKAANDFVTIVCKRHGDFEQRAQGHLQGKGCPECGHLAVSEKLRSSPDAFLAKATARHGIKYDYSKVVYLGNKIPVIITCPIHGDFKQKPNQHLSGQGCPRCGRFRAQQKRTRPTSAFVEQANAVHRNYYEYSKANYSGAHTKVTITCPKHGDFAQKPHDHLYGSGCSKCGRSKGEQRIARVLEEMNIEFTEQYRDKRCRGKLPLPFDFALLSSGELLGLIEFHGIQHFESWRNDRRNIREGLCERQMRDEVKSAFCQDHNLPLLVIPYWESGHIRELISQFVETLDALNGIDLAIQTGPLRPGVSKENALM